MCLLKSPCIQHLCHWFLLGLEFRLLDLPQTENQKNSDSCKEVKHVKTYQFPDQIDGTIYRKYSERLIVSVPLS